MDYQAELLIRERVNLASAGVGGSLGQFTHLEVQELFQRIDKLREALEDVINQACGDGSGGIDSMSLTAYQEAIELLAECERIKITTQAGRRIIAHFIKW